MSFLSVFEKKDSASSQSSEEQQPFTLFVETFVKVCIKKKKVENKRNLCKHSKKPDAERSTKKVQTKVKA